MTFKWAEKDVVIVKKDKRNRYSLTCVWDAKKPAVAFIMINPSTGSVERADRTLNRCRDFAASWGYGSMKIVNLYSEISPKPNVIGTPTPLEYTFNQKAIKRAIKDSDKVILAWGENGDKVKNRELAQQVIHMVDREKCYCIEKSANGRFPKHPLFLSKGLKPVRWI